MGNFLSGVLNTYHFSEFTRSDDVIMIGISSTIGKSNMISSGESIHLSSIAGIEVKNNNVILKLNYTTNSCTQSFGPICRYKKCIETINKIEEYLGVEKTDITPNDSDICMHGEGAKRIPY